MNFVFVGIGYLVMAAAAAGVTYKGLCDEAHAQTRNAFARTPHVLPDHPNTRTLPHLRPAGPSSKYSKGAGELHGGARKAIYAEAARTELTLLLGDSKIGSGQK